jgi:hypothetical protein
MKVFAHKPVPRGGDLNYFLRGFFLTGFGREDLGTERMVPRAVLNRSKGGFMVGMGIMIPLCCKGSTMSSLTAREALDAMVCGLPTHLRKNWLLCMLVSYADDSGSDKKGPVFVLSGYVSMLEQWQRFSDALHLGLNSGPRPLKYFKMQDAAFSGKGQFKGWHKRDRDAKTLELAKIIQNYAMFAVNAVL